MQQYTSYMTSTLLEGVLEPLAACLTPEAARHIVDLRADPAAQQKLDELAEKSNEGTLTVDGRAEYDRILAAWDVMTILQAKAQTRLREVA